MHMVLWSQGIDISCLLPCCDIKGICRDELLQHQLTSVNPSETNPLGESVPWSSHFPATLTVCTQDSSFGLTGGFCLLKEFELGARATVSLPFSAEVSDLKGDGSLETCIIGRDRREVKPLKLIEQHLHLDR